MLDAGCRNIAKIWPHRATGRIDVSNSREWSFDNVYPERSRMGSRQAKQWLSKYSVEIKTGGCP